MSYFLVPDEENKGARLVLCSSKQRVRGRATPRPDGRWAWAFLDGIYREHCPSGIVDRLEEVPDKIEGSWSIASASYAKAEEERIAWVKTLHVGALVSVELNTWMHDYKRINGVVEAPFATEALRDYDGKVTHPAKPAWRIQEEDGTLTVFDAANGERYGTRGNVTAGERLRPRL